MSDAAPEPPIATSTDEAFLRSLTETDLYSVGAFFCDQHPDLVDEVVARSEEIERQGLAAYAGKDELGIEQTYQTLLTGLAVRYYKAVAS